MNIVHLNAVFRIDEKIIITVTDMSSLIITTGKISTENRQYPLDELLVCHMSSCN